MNEYGFIKSVHRYLPPELFKWKIHDTFAGGVPDAFYAGPSGILFAEYKYVKQVPKRDSSVLKTSLSVQQKLWLDRMVDFNQRAVVIIGCEELAIVIHNKEWNAPLFKSEYVKRAVSRKEVADWIAGVCL
jgi:hypothetical protein